MATMSTLHKQVQQLMKSELELDLNLNEVAVVVNSVLEATQATLVAEGSSLRTPIGTFNLRTRKARKARNPKTGESLDVPATEVITFKSKHKKVVA